MLVVVDVAGQARKRDLRVAGIAGEPDDGHLTCELYVVPIPDRKKPWGSRCWSMESFSVETLPTVRVLCRADLTTERSFTD
eukprot:13822221-Heterocapsa_arctica.AAC.1